MELGSKKVVRIQKLTDEEATTQCKVNAQYRKNKEQQKTQVGNFVATLGRNRFLRRLTVMIKMEVLKKGEDTLEEIKNYWIFDNLLLYMV